MGIVVSHTVVRLAIPLGLATTAAVWSTVRKGSLERRSPEAYSKVFIAMASIGGVSLLVSPFINIGKLGHHGRRKDVLGDKEAQRVSEASQSTAGEKIPTVAIESTIPLNGDAGVWRGAQIGPRASSLSTNLVRRSVASHRVLSRATADDSDIAGLPLPRVPGRHSRDHSTLRCSSQYSTPRTDRVMWVVCEDCGVRKRAAAEPLGDPKRYFHDTKH